MLNGLLIVLLLAVDLTAPLKKSPRMWKKPPRPLPARCDSVKCPAEERPACARLSRRHNGNLSQALHVIVLNECELNYVKCHEGLEAKIVPMKNCGHENILKTSRKRAKREVSSGLWFRRYDHGPVRKGHARQAPEDSPHPEAGAEAGAEALAAGFPAGAPPSDNSIQEGIEDVNYEEHVAKKLHPPFLNPESETVEEEDLEVQQTPGYEEHVTKKLHPPFLNPELETVEEEDLEVQQTPGADGEAVADGSASAELIFSYHKEGKRPNKGIQLDDEDPDMDQYLADCPTVCPARDVAVCARCQHGVHRTFLSVCHMRMFQCKHTDEKLTLMARLPCVLSAPFLVGEKQKPRGRVREEGDDDKVVRFIRCSAMSDLSREDDPRCYLERQKFMLQLETYNISDQY